MFGPGDQALAYDIRVDAPADWWHRWRYEKNGLRVLEFASNGFTFKPKLVLDTVHVAISVAIPFAILAVLGFAQFGRARKLREQLAETSVRLSEAEAQSGLFPADGSVPTRIHQYDVVERLGLGGMAVVYKVRKNGQEYALKLPLPHLLEDPEYRARFVRELKLGKVLTHPNLVHIYDVNDGEGEYGYPYMVMELVSGLPLNKRMRLAPLGVDAVARLGVQVLEALGSIHARGVVHRDVKPGNVMVTGSGNAKLMDFGIAFHEDFGDGGRLTATGDLLGTPPYLAPEQIQGERQTTDPRVDIYATGLLLYQSISGRLPWDATDSVAVVLEKISRDPPPLVDVRKDVPQALSDCVVRMLARDPDDRYATAGEAAEALRAALATMETKS